MNAPYVQLDVDRFLADTDWLTLEESAVYGRLIFKAWKQEPAGTLPDDDLMLSRLARVDQSKWQEVKPAVMSLFKLGKDKRWHHTELRANFEKLRLKRKNGQKAANARWSKSDDDNLPDADAMQTHSERNANASNPHSERNAYKDEVEDKVQEEKKPATTATARAPDDSIPDPLGHWAVLMFEEELGVKPHILGAQLIAAKVTNREVWLRVLGIWKGNRHAIEKIGNVVDRYENEVRKLAERSAKEAGKPNGQHKGNGNGSVRESASARNAREYLESAELLARP
jgi:uncharacterized protein YdaU (DUF1376 family)